MDEPVKRTKGFKNILSLDAITAHYVRARTPASCGDLADDIGDGLTGGSNMEEVEASRESSGSVGGAGGRDLRLERGMLG